VLQVVGIPTHIEEVYTMLQLGDQRVRDCDSEIQKKVPLKGTHRRVMSTIDMLQQLGLLERDMVADAKASSTEPPDQDTVMHKFYHVKRNARVMIPPNAPKNIRAEAQGRTFSFGGSSCEFAAYWTAMAGGFVHAWSVEGREDAGNAAAARNAEGRLVALLSKKRMWVSFTDVALTPEIRDKAMDAYYRMQQVSGLQGPPTVDLANRIADEINESREAVARHIR
jgi:hypothetical protein